MWNSKVDGHVSNRLWVLALDCFREIREVQHDGVGIIVELAACCLELALQRWEVHAYGISYRLEQDFKVSHPSS